MEEILKEFKSVFEKRYKTISVLEIGEDSVRYDFFKLYKK